MPPLPSWAALFFGVQHVLEHASQLPLVEALRGLEGIERDAVAERERGGREDVAFLDLAAAGQRGGRLGALEDRDVGAMAGDAHAHDEPCDRAVQLASHDDAGEQLDSARQPAAQGLLLFLPGRGKRLGVGIPGLAPAQHLGPDRGVLDAVDLDVEADAVGELRAQVALLGVHRPDQHEARRMGDRDALALDRVDAHRGRVEQDVGEVVVQQVDLVDVEDAAIGGRQQPGLERHRALAQRARHVDRARDAILGGVQREIDDPPRAARDGQLAAARAHGALPRRRRRGAREGTAGHDLDLSQQRRQAAHRRRLGRAARPLHEHPADRRRDGRQQERLLEALLLDDRAERIDRNRAT